MPGSVQAAAPPRKRWFKRVLGRSPVSSRFAPQDQGPFARELQGMARPRCILLHSVFMGPGQALRAFREDTDWGTSGGGSLPYTPYGR